MTSLARIVTGPDDAPTLVLLHGITGSAVSLAEAIDHWVGRGYRVVAVDARGHGLSPRWEPAELERAGEVLVEDLIAVLEELEAASRGRAALGLPTPPAPVVIGHSMGAATAMVAAVRRPDLVTGVVTPEVPWDEAMAALDVPALLLTGDRPGSARVGSEGLATASRNPRITPVLVPGAGHQVRRSDPQAFYRAVDAWLAEVLPVD